MNLPKIMTPLRNAVGFINDELAQPIAFIEGR